jgi:hypothetical protein
MSTVPAVILGIDTPIGLALIRDLGKSDISLLNQHRSQLGTYTALSGCAEMGIARNTKR